MGTVTSPGAVVMAVFRPNALLLARQVASLRAQTVTQWRCIVGIDGQDPEVHALLVELIDGDARFEIHDFEANVGVYRHFERLLRRVPNSSPWVALADQDDFWDPDKFEILLAAMSRTDVSAVTGQARLVDTSGRKFGVTERRPGNVAQTLLRNQITGSLVMFRRSVLDLAFPFPPATDIAIHDHWLGVCAAASGRIELSRRSVQDYVQHERNVLGEVRPTTVRETLGQVRANGGLRRHLDAVSRERWGWRVSMARALQERSSSASERGDVRAVIAGRLTLPLCCLILSNVARRRLRPKAALGVLAAAWWWPRVERPTA